MDTSLWVGWGFESSCLHSPFPFLVDSRALTSLCKHPLSPSFGPTANWGPGTGCSFLFLFILQVIARKNILDAESDHQSLLGHLPVVLAWKHFLAT